MIAFADDDTASVERRLLELLHVLPRFQLPEEFQGTNLRQTYDRVLAQVDRVPPVLRIRVELPQQGAPVKIRVEVTDDSAISTATVYLEQVGHRPRRSYQLIQLSDNEWTAEIDVAGVAAQSDIPYEVRVTDEWGNTGTYTGHVITPGVLDPAREETPAADLERNVPDDLIDQEDSPKSDGRGFLYVALGVLVAAGAGAAAFILGSVDEGAGAAIKPVDTPPVGYPVSDPPDPPLND